MKVKVSKACYSVWHAFFYPCIKPITCIYSGNPIVILIGNVIANAIGTYIPALASGMATFMAAGTAI
jgi:hypothetical protein